VWNAGLVAPPVGLATSYTVDLVLAMLSPCGAEESATRDSLTQVGIFFHDNNDRISRLFICFHGGVDGHIYASRLGTARIQSEKNYGCVVP
jgi:hypothetical protein